MTVIRPNSVAGINSITVQSGNSLAVHKSDGTLIQTITGASGVSTFSSVSVGSATTTNDAGKSINIGLGASISQHTDNTLTFGIAGDPVAKFDASGQLLLGTGTARQKLHINASDSGAANMVFTNTTTGTSAGDGFIVGISGAEDAQINMQESANLKFSTADTERLRITSSGRVNAVGIVSATGGLQVGTAATIKAGGNATFSGIVTAASFIGDGSGLSGVTAVTINSNADNRIITGSGSANTLNGESNLTFDGSALAYSAGGAERFNLAHTSGGIVALKNPSNSSMQFGTNDTTRMTITSGGGVGIGTESPDFEFTVADASGAAVIRAKDGANSKIVDLIANSTGGLLRTVGSYPLVLNTNQTERLRIGPSGGVGISTDKIRNADFLHIATLSQDFTNPTEELMDGGGICFQNTNHLASTGQSFPGIFWAPNTANLGRARAGLIGVAASNNDATDIVFLGKYLPGGDGLYPRDERMRIRAQSGYVGINTSLPDRQLHIVGGDGPTQATAGNSDTILVLDNKGTNGAIVEFKAETNGAGRIMFTDTDASNRGKIEYLHSSDTLQFSSNGGNPGYELQSDSKSRFNVVNSKVLIDKNNTGIILDFDKSGTGVGNISITSSNTSYNTSSDYRLKENVVGITSAITRLKTLKPSRFNFKIDPSVTVDGFLAHEVTAVPEATTGTKDQVATADDVTSGIATAVGDPIYQGIDQSKLVPLLTAALQEAITKIETLETKVAALEGG